MRYAIDFESSPPTVDGRPLVFYHFHAFKARGSRLFELGPAVYPTLPRRLRIALYRGIRG